MLELADPDPDPDPDPAPADGVDPGEAVPPAVDPAGSFAAAGAASLDDDVPSPFAEAPAVDDVRLSVL